MITESRSALEPERRKGVPAPASDAPEKTMADPEWAWAAYRPDARRPWNLSRVCHLYRRAAFGASKGQLDRALSDGPQRTIERLLRPDADVIDFHRKQDRYEASASSTEVLAAWWLRRMIHTPQPLLEKMTLFWHGHFAIGNARVKSPAAMRRYLALLREHALGSGAALFQGISREPAVLLGVDSKVSRKARPSDRYARTLMELYALGPGHYTERDVEEAARAFTGRFVLRDELRTIPREHDTGVKRIFGAEGQFNAEDAVRLVLEQPATASSLVRKLYRWLISETREPGDDIVKPLADSFAGDHDIARLVETMLRSNLFFSQAAYRQRIKSPVEFALGIVQGLEGRVGTAPLGRDLEGLGQDLFHPPTIKGWAGGRTWINRFTILGRGKLARALLSNEGPYEERLAPLAVAKKYGREKPERARELLIDLFLDGNLADDVRQALIESSGQSAATSGDDAADQLRLFAQSLTTLPEFHLA